jgi:hypothetical protein
MPLSATHIKYLVVLAVAIALSVGGIAYAVHGSKNKDDGGRGGALAVAVAFIVLFVSRSQGARVYTILAEEGPELLNRIEAQAGATPDPAAKQADGSPAETKVDALLAKLRTDANEQRIQNIYLALTSVIGTLAWGFGDLIAKRFI